MALGKQRSAGVHHQRLGLRGDFVRDFGADNVCAFDAWESIAIRPVFGLMLDIKIEFAGLECLEGNVAIAVELHLDLVEIVLAAVDRQFLAPPVFYPLKGQAATRFHLGDAIRPAAQWWRIGGGLEVAVFPVMLGQHRQFAQVQNQQWIVGLLKHKANAMAAENIDALNVLQIGAVLRVALLDQQAVGERHVVRGDWHTVVKHRLGAQIEHHPAAIVAVFNRASDQAIAGRRLVSGRIVLAAAGHQRLV